MKNLLVSCVALGAMLVGSTSLAEDVAIKVSPNVINIKAPVPSVTVHTNIPFSSVVPDTVALNEVSADSVFADDCGNLVAKFDADGGIKEFLKVGEVTLKLTGTTIRGDAFAGSDTVKVINVGK